MKRLLTITNAALIASSLLAVPALAQVSLGASGEASGDLGIGVDLGGANVGVDTTGGASGGASTETDSGVGGIQADAATGLDGTATAATDAQADLGQVVSSIQSSKAIAAELAAVGDASVVNVISVGATATREQLAALQNVVAENPDALAALRDSIENNAAVSSALESHGVDAAAVVAATVNADGSVTVYTL